MVQRSKKQRVRSDPYARQSEGVPHNQLHTFQLGNDENTFYALPITRGRKPKYAFPAAQHINNFQLPKPLPHISSVVASTATATDLPGPQCPTDRQAANSILVPLAPDLTNNTALDASLPNFIHNYGKSTDPFASLGLHNTSEDPFFMPMDIPKADLADISSLDFSLFDFLDNDVASTNPLGLHNTSTPFETFPGVLGEEFFRDLQEELEQFQEQSR